MDLDVYGGCKETVTTLKLKAFSGLKWNTLSQFGRQGVYLITTIILARLLEPADFGVVGMALVVSGFIGIFKDLGTSSAIIRRPTLSDVFLGTMYWVNFGFGVLATLVVILLAPFAGLYYNEPLVIPVLQILSFAFAISGLGSVHQAILERSLAFNSLATLEIASVVVGAVVGIGLAMAHAGVWSLVFQTMVTTFVSTLLLIVFSAWRPRLVFNWKEVIAVRQFSVNLVGFNIVNYFARNADYFLIGRFLGAESLGFYTLAYRILLYPLHSVSAVIGRVMYPVLSTVQNDLRKFRSVYLDMLGGIALVTFPLMTTFLVLSRPFVMTVFGEKWTPVIVLIEIFAPVGLIQSLGTTVGVIYQVTGKTDLMFRWGVASGIVVVTSFLIGLKWGIIGVASAYALVVLALAYPNFLFPFNLIELKFMQLFVEIRKPFINSLVLLVIILCVRSILEERYTDLLVLTAAGFGGIIVYCLMSLITNKRQLHKLWDLATGDRRK
ncbi:MAG: MOP flippase family protein [Chloroflexi bacterium]|nr:MOP flippase family protein [Chloroflexota bacterium]